jgi:tetratricopeptide (TPR) repeat protein
MNRLFIPFLIFIFACCFSLATELGSEFEAIHAKTGRSTDPLIALVGDSRRLFANQFFIMADVYFHSGYYPTIFDAKKQTGPTHLDVASHDESAETNKAHAEPDDDDNFMGTPKDWIEAFGRNFIPTVHTHLDDERSREILPWLKLSADMDPHRIDTYVTAAYWLRTRLNKPDEAEKFLREGIAANPESPDLYLELGRVYFYNRHDSKTARNLWKIALDRWRQQELAKAGPDPDVQEQILGELVRDDQQDGNLKQLLTDLEALEKSSIRKDAIDTYIQKIKAQLGQP